jgi:hypothetical protein
MAMDNQPRKRARTEEGTFKGNPDNPSINEAWEATPLTPIDPPVKQKITTNGSKPKIGATEKVVKPNFMDANITTY